MKKSAPQFEQWNSVCFAACATLLKKITTIIESGQVGSQGSLADEIEQFDLLMKIIERAHNAGNVAIKNIASAKVSELKLLGTRYDGGMNTKVARTKELARLNEIARAIAPLIEQGNIQAANTYLKLLEQRQKLLGLNEAQPEDSDADLIQIYIPEVEEIAE